MSHTDTAGVLLLIALWAVVYLAHLPFVGPTTEFPSVQQNNRSFNGSWYPPNRTQINDLEAVVNGSDVFGFIFSDAYSPPSKASYAIPNWCNMPHVNSETYPVPPAGYTLEYVEVIHRHHKRTPYAANTFPRESYTWDCDDEGLFTYGKPLNPSGNASASTYWALYTSRSNPFAPQGFNGTCQFPQITRGGLDDSWQHGKDLFEVYKDRFGSRLVNPSDQVSYRVTNNVITSQVAGMVVAAMYESVRELSLAIQPASIDSLEPTYTCDAGAALYSSYGVGSTNSNWTKHLTASEHLFDVLDNISGVAPNDPGFHQSWDHYFDNLSSRLCHGKPLPCKIGNSTSCVTSSTANAVFRLGLYEYSYIYRSSYQSLSASTASYGVYIAELAQNIRDSISGASPIIYKHNVAHDGSLAMLLSILQVDVMIWPGLGAELVFEIYNKSGERYVRILWGGSLFRSSNPVLGLVDMLPLDTLLGYFDGLVGVGASKVPAMCANAG